MARSRRPPATVRPGRRDRAVVMCPTCIRIGCARPPLWHTHLHMRRSVSACRAPQRRLAVIESLTLTPPTSPPTYSCAVESVQQGESAEFQGRRYPPRRHAGSIARRERQNAGARAPPDPACAEHSLPPRKSASGISSRFPHSRYDNAPPRPSTRSRSSRTHPFPNPGRSSSASAALGTTCTCAAVVVTPWRLVTCADTSPRPSTTRASLGTSTSSPRTLPRPGSSRLGRPGQLHRPMKSMR